MGNRNAPLQWQRGKGVGRGLAGGGGGGDFAAPQHVRYVHKWRMIQSIEQISISKFKATCLAVLERLRRIRVPVVVTNRVPIAEIKPLTEVGAEARVHGSHDRKLAPARDVLPFLPPRCDHTRLASLRGRERIQGCPKRHHISLGVLQVTY